MWQERILRQSQAQAQDFGFLFSGDIKLHPTKADCFFEYRFFGDVCFVRDESAKIKEIKWKGYNFDLLLVKQ